MPGEFLIGIAGDVRDGLRLYGPIPADANGDVFFDRHARSNTEVGEYLHERRWLTVSLERLKSKDAMPLQRAEPANVMVLVEGAPFDGLSFSGPFAAPENDDDIGELGEVYADRNREWWIVELKPVPLTRACRKFLEAEIANRGGVQPATLGSAMESLMQGADAEAEVESELDDIIQVWGSEQEIAPVLAQPTDDNNRG